MGKKLKYPIIGGELDGQVADYASFYEDFPGHYPAGEFVAFRNDYVPYNCAQRGGGYGVKGPFAQPSMVWLHVTLLREPVRQS